MGASRFSENKQLQEIELRHCKTESIFSLEHVRARLFVSCVTLFFWQMIRCDQCWLEACKLGLKLYYRSIHTCWDSVQVKCQNQASDFLQMHLRVCWGWGRVIGHPLSTETTHGGSSSWTRADKWNSSSAEEELSVKWALTVLSEDIASS